MQTEKENNQPELTKDEQLSLLNRFLVNNSELEELSAKLSIFNILNVLRIEKAEIGALPLKPVPGGSPSPEHILNLKKVVDNFID